jgi:hypothetical protein
MRVGVATHHQDGTKPTAFSSVPRDTKRELARDASLLALFVALTAHIEADCLLLPFGSDPYQDAWQRWNTSECFQ